MRWLTRFLRGWRGEMILITHHREFMDQVTTHTMAIHRCMLRKAEGTTHKVFAQIAQEEEIHEKDAPEIRNGYRRQQERFIQRFRAKATKARALQSRVKKLEKMETLERLDEIHGLSFRFHAAPFAAKKIMDEQELSFHYPDGPTLMEGLNFRVGAKDSDRGDRPQRSRKDNAPVVARQCPAAGHRQDRAASQRPGGLLRSGIMWSAWIPIGP